MVQRLITVPFKSSADRIFLDELVVNRTSGVASLCERGASWGQNFGEGGQFLFAKIKNAYPGKMSNFLPKIK